MPTDTSHLRAALRGLCALLIGIGLGRFGYPPLIPLLIRNHWFTAGQADYLGAFNLAGYVAGSAVAGILAQRLHVATSVRIAMLTVVTGFIACAWPNNFLWFVFWRFGAGVAGGVLMVIGAPSMLASIPAAVRGRIGGIIFTGVGAGVAISGALVPVFAAWGVRDAWLSLGIASGILTIAAWTGWNRQLPTEEAPAEHGGKLSWILFWLLAAYVTNAIGFVPHTVFWVDYIARGLDRGLAAGNHYWIVLGISATLGPLASGWLADRIGFSRSLRLNLVLNAVAVAIPVVWNTPLALTLSSVGVGGMAMGTTSLAAGRVAVLVSPSRQKQVWGWMTVAFSVSLAGTAFLMSAIFATSGNYHGLFLIGSLALLAGSAFDWIGSLSQSSQSR